MKYFSVALLLQVTFVGPIFSQVTNEVKLDDDYSTVIGKVRSDLLAKYYNIMESNKMIRVSIKSGSGLHESSIVEYLFGGNKLKRIYFIQSMNPRGTLSFMYQTNSPEFGDPVKVRTEGKDMVYWRMPGPDRRYFFLSYSDWFQKECLFVLQTKEKFETASNRKK